MARRRFFVDSVRGPRAVLRGAEAQHVRRVLRAEPGQQYEISDNHDAYLAEIESLGRDQVLFRILDKLPPVEPPVRLVLFAALVKFDRFEWILEKATELGVELVAPVEAERSEKGLALAARKRLGRWRKIVRESSQQARRVRMPEVLDPMTLAAAVEARTGPGYFLDEQPGTPALLAALEARRSRADEVALLVGPEGGWTGRERELAVSHGWAPVSLGPLILRADTAALAALAVLMSWSALGPDAVPAVSFDRL